MSTSPEQSTDRRTTNTAEGIGIAKVPNTKNLNDSKIAAKSTNSSEGPVSEKGTHSPTEEAQMDASKRNKVEDLLLAPIVIPRPRKRPAVKSILREFGAYHTSKRLKKVIPIKVRLNPKSSGRKSAPGKAVASAAVRQVYEGPPTEALEGGWPEGWLKKVIKRMTGDAQDRYWYSPIERIKFRSMVEGASCV